MLKKIDQTDLGKVEKQLFTFIWNYKRGDNIIYNFEILATLYRSSSKLPKPGIFNKPITITIVSILEAILNDFLDRLFEATKHLPKNIPLETLRKVKAEMRRAKRPAKTKGGRLYYRRKMYRFTEIVSILERQKLFGAKGAEIYALLKLSGNMRDCVQLKNYCATLEEDEHEVFNSERLCSLERVLDLLWAKMISDCKRPWTRRPT